jgi:hypothetical protein
VLRTALLRHVFRVRFGVGVGGSLFCHSFMISFMRRFLFLSDAVFSQRLSRHCPECAISIWPYFFVSQIEVRSE